MSRIASLRAGAGALLAILLLAACGGSPASSPGPTITVTEPGSTGPANSSTPAQAGPGIVGVTTAGALVRVDPTTGHVAQTLVASGVAGGEVAVSPDGSTVYFTQASGCTSNIVSIPINGGPQTVVTAGSLPAISPDGSKLAYAHEPLQANQSCIPTTSSRVVVRDLQSGAQTDFSMPPTAVQNGLPAPVSYLSWAGDNTRLAVSVASVQDNEGWSLNLVDTSTAHYYLSSPGVTVMLPTGQPTPSRSYLRLGIFLPNGDLFVTRACCGGFPVHNTSQLLWEVTDAGSLVHQVAVGYPAKTHLSLASDSSGQWLLYLSGHDLYVSQAGARPVLLASGFTAATWV